MRTKAQTTLFVTFIDDLERMQLVYWAFFLNPGESIKLCFIANRRTILYKITSHNLSEDLFLTDIFVSDESQICESIPLLGFTNHFSVPKMRYADSKQSKHGEKDTFFVNDAIVLYVSMDGQALYTYALNK